MRARVSVRGIGPEGESVDHEDRELELGTISQELTIHMDGVLRSRADYVNFSLVASEPNSGMIQVVLAQVMPPPITTAEEAEQISASGVPATIVARALLSAETAQNLVESLKPHIDYMQRASQLSREGSDGEE